MPNYAKGPKVKKRAILLLEALLKHQENLFQLERKRSNVQVEVKWFREDIYNFYLFVKTSKLLNLVSLIKEYKSEAPDLTKNQIMEVLRQLQNLSIFEDRREKSQGSSEWKFILKLWYKDIENNLARLDIEWDSPKKHSFVSLSKSLSEKTCASNWLTVEEIWNPKLRACCDFSKSIQVLIEQLLCTYQSESQRWEAAWHLGNIGISNLNAINALTQVLNSNGVQKLLWQAALSLGKIDPNNSLAGFSQGKYINFAQNKYVRLIVDCKRVNRAFDVRIQIHSSSYITYLPRKMKMTILNEYGNILRSKEAKESQHILEISFYCDLGDRFSLKIELHSFCNIEYFVI